MIENLVLLPNLVKEVISDAEFNSTVQLFMRSTRYFSSKLG